MDWILDFTYAQYILYIHYEIVHKVQRSKMKKNV